MTPEKLHSSPENVDTASNSIYQQLRSGVRSYFGGVFAPKPRAGRRRSAVRAPAQIQQLETRSLMSAIPITGDIALIAADTTTVEDTSTANNEDSTTNFTPSSNVIIDTGDGTILTPSNTTYVDLEQREDVYWIDTTGKFIQATSAVEAEEENIETIDVTPTFSAKDAGDFLEVKYENMPNGIKAVIVSAGTNSGITDVEMSEGSGSLLIHLPHDSNKNAEIALYDTNANSFVGNRIGFTFSNHRITSAPDETISHNVHELEHSKEISTNTLKGVELVDSLQDINDANGGETLVIPTYQYNPATYSVSMQYWDMPDGFELAIVQAGRNDESAMATAEINKGSSSITMNIPRAITSAALVVRDAETHEEVGARTSIGIHEWKLSSEPNTSAMNIPRLAHLPNTELRVLQVSEFTAVDQVFSNPEALSAILDNEGSEEVPLDTISIEDGSAHFNISSDVQSAVLVGGDELAAWVNAEFQFNGSYQKVGADREYAMYMHDGNNIWTALGADGTMYKFPEENTLHGSWEHRIPVAKIPTKYYENPELLYQLSDADAQQTAHLDIQDNQLHVALTSAAIEGENLRIMLRSNDGTTSEKIIHIAGSTPSIEDIAHDIAVATVAMEKQEQAEQFIAELSSSLVATLESDIQRTVAALEAESEEIVESVSLANEELQRLQGIQLFQRSEYYVHGNEIEPRLAQTLPHIFPENLEEYILAEADRRNVHAGLIQDNILMQQSEYREEGRKLLGAYEQHMSDLMNEGVDLWAQVAMGGDENALKETYLQHANAVRSFRYIVEARAILNVEIPSNNHLLNETKRLFNEEQALLSHMQGEQTRLQEIEDFRAGNEAYQLAHLYNVSPEAVEQINQDLSESFAVSLLEIYEDYKDDPDGLQLALTNYAVAHPDEYLAFNDSPLSTLIADLQNEDNLEVAFQEKLSEQMDTLNPDYLAETVKNGEHLAKLHYLPSSGALDKWYATVGEEPIDVTWSVEVDRPGSYTLRVSGLNGWDLSDAIVLMPGGELPLTLDTAGYSTQTPLDLAPGTYNFTIRNIRVPEEAGVATSEFSLIRHNGYSVITEKQFHSSFIADHPEKFDETSVFKIEGNDGNTIEIQGVTALTNHFAPILHFTEGERFSVPFAVSPDEIPTNGSSDSEMDLSEYADTNQFYTEENTESAIYANVLENPEGTEIAINYHFYYPRSNWGEDPDGFNTHEGDWEGFTLFLAKDANGKYNPDRIALAQHLNILGGKTESTDGIEVINWNETSSSNNSQIHLFVGLGGHATYATNGETDWGTGIEDHTGSGIVYDGKTKVVSLTRISEDKTLDSSWLTYTGNWGDEDINKEFWKAGDNAPFGPALSDRWYNPWDWENTFVK